MKKIAFGVLMFLGLCSGVFAQNGRRAVELKDITDGKFINRSSVGEMRSMSDGEHYTAMNENRSMIIKYAYRTGQAVDTLFNAARARECTFEDFDDYEISSTGYRVLILRETEGIYRHSTMSVVYDYDVRRNYIKPLMDTSSKQMIPTFSPDGRMCAFVVDNNIWIKKFDYDTEVQVTKDGEVNKILNGTTDWVYEEEFTVTNLMAWSPDNETLAYVRFDESNVKEFHMQIYGSGAYPGFYSFKYPKAGEENSKITLHAYNVTTKDTKQLDAPIDKDAYIPMIKFTTNSDQLAVMTLNRHQNVLNMYYANPKSGVFRLILHDENKAYIDSEWLSSISFYKDEFLYVSEQDGYAHIYSYSLTGAMQRQITKGNWDVTDFMGMDEATKTVYYESAEESPLRRSVYSMNARGVKTKLSTREGTNNASFSANFAYYVNRYSNTGTPLVISVHDTNRNRELRVLQDNEALKKHLNDYSFSDMEFFKVSTASGNEFNAWMVKPVNFNAGQKYPVLMIQYSGPNSQQVLDKYTFGWEHYLASKGIIVVCVDGRGTGARGEDFRKCTYLKMGALESQDQVDAAHALARQFSYIDGNRMAIWGWSFGGYNALMAMSVGNGTFKTGIAVAPPTDWRFYDTVYTERFMRTPQENFDGYAKTSPIELADKLQGKLLLIHGTADDNVHFNQTMIYAEALVQAGKQFDMHIYKDKDHSIYGGNTRYHLYTKMANFLIENL